jgi:hypothetical protein
MAEQVRRYVVDADVVAADGGSDGAYSLLGVWTANELAQAMAEVLSVPDGVRGMLLRGGTAPVGHVLSIRIYDAATDTTPCGRCGALAAPTSHYDPARSDHVCDRCSASTDFCQCQRCQCGE